MDRCKAQCRLKAQYTIHSNLRDRTILFVSNFNLTMCLATGSLRALASATSASGHTITHVETASRITDFLPVHRIGDCTGNDLDGLVHLVIHGERSDTIYTLQYTISRWIVMSSPFLASVTCSS
jgi:hypothetical protein